MEGFEVVDLSLIVLEPISPESYKLRETPWRDDRKIVPGEAYARIVNPVRDEDYERLFWALGNTPEIHRVDVRFREEWLRRTPSMLADFVECRLLAYVCSMDRCKRNFLEAHITSNGEFLASIGFGEFKGEVIGYKMRIFSAGGALFGLDGTKFTYCNGIWVSPTYEKKIEAEEQKIATG